jgi:hypothetical protein
LDNISNYKVLVIGGDEGSWNHETKPENKSYITGIEAWVYALNADYKYSLKTTSKDIEKYDIIIYNSNLFALKHCLKLCQSKTKGQFWITIIEGSASDYLAPNHAFIELLNYSDLVNVINEKSLEFFRGLTETKAEYIGIPYPIDNIKKYTVPYEKRNKKIFLCSNPLDRCNDFIVAQKSGLNSYCFEKLISRKIRNIPIFIKNRTLDKQFYLKKASKIYNESKLEIRPEIPLKAHFETNNSAFIWLNLDPRFTWGRYVIDAAALQIPIITTYSTGHARKLFPETCLDSEFEIEKALNLVNRLNNDFDFYKFVAEYPSNKLEYLTEKVIVKKLFDSIEETRK